MRNPDSGNVIAIVTLAVTEGIGEYAARDVGEVAEEALQGWTCPRHGGLGQPASPLLEDRLEIVVEDKDRHSLQADFESEPYGGHALVGGEVEAEAIADRQKALECMGAALGPGGEGWHIKGAEKGALLELGLKVLGDVVAVSWAGFSLWFLNMGVGVRAAE